MILSRKWRSITLLVYVILLLSGTIFLRDEKAKLVVKTDVLWSYFDKTARENLMFDHIQNIVAFVPIGFLICSLTTEFRLVKALLTGLLISFAIEFLQFEFQRGVVDVDDLFNNTLGAFFGFMLFKIIEKILR